MPNGLQQRHVRLFMAFCVLSALWIFVYWAWEPQSPAIVFNQMNDEGREDSPVRPVNGEQSESDRSGSSEPPVASEPDAEPADGATENSPDQGQPAPPGHEEYTLERSYANWEDLARSLFGSEDLAEVLAKTNPLTDERRLSRGRKIRIPTKPGNVERAPSPKPDTSELPRAEVEYRVEEGDTLSDISQRFYGTSIHARRIYEWNKERLGLTSINSIRKGQVLLIPPEPED